MHCVVLSVQLAGCRGNSIVCSKYCRVNRLKGNEEVYSVLSLVSSVKGVV